MASEGLEWQKVGFTGTRVRILTGSGRGGVPETRDRRSRSLPEWHRVNYRPRKDRKFRGSGKESLRKVGVREDIQRQDHGTSKGSIHREDDPTLGRTGRVVPPGL